MDGQMAQPDISSADLQAMIDAATRGPWHQSHRKAREGEHSTQVYCSVGAEIATFAWYPMPKDERGVIGTYRGANAELASHAPDLAAEVINLRAAKMALVAGQAKAHAAGYAQGVTEAASACNNIRCEYAESHQSSMAFAAMVCCDVIAALSPRGQDHAPDLTVGGA